MPDAHAASGAIASAVGDALGAGPPGVTWGVCVRDAASGEVLAAAGADRPLPAASIGKVFLLIEVARSLDLGEPLTRAPEDAVADSGLWQHLATDTLPAGDLAALVGAVSDNLAANVLLRRVGLDAVRRTTRELGITDSALHDRVRDERSAGHPPALSTATAAELTTLFTRLWAPGGALAPRVADRVLGWLALGADLSMVAAAFGLDPLAHARADRGLRLRHKTGTDAGVRAEGGLLEGPRRTLAYAVLARFDDARRDEVLAVMRAIGAACKNGV
jgi:beta-lactamase class A